MRQVYSATLAAIAIISAFTPSTAFGQSPPTGLSITNYQIVSEQRVSATQSYYAVRADLVNSGPARSALTATASSTVPTIEVQGLGNLHFGPIAANSQATSLDTFTILVTNTVPLNFSNLQWSFIAPVANAGPNQTAALGSTVTLNGSASTNPSGIGFLSYAWTFLQRPPGTSATIPFSSEAITSFHMDVVGEFIVQLTVSNGTGPGQKDIAVIKVTGGNSAPVANAGPNQTVSIGANVQLNGSASTDVDGDALTYAWTILSKPSGSTAAVSNATIVNPTFTADKGGTYTVQLVVNDGHGNNSAPSTVTITTQNSPPVANAGPNQTVNVGTTVQLNGAASTDVNGDTLTFLWSLITRPAGSAAALSSTTAVNPTFVADIAGTYVAQLVVNDGQVSSSAATVTITTGTVLPPTANAGPNQTVQHGTLVTLHGTGTDPQSLPLTFQWALITVPLNSLATLSSPTAQNPTFVADLPGNYVAQLIVNNGSVNSAPSTVSITTTNTAPVANAGSNRAVATGSTVSLSGIGSTDADADPLTYAWSFTSRPAGSSAFLNSANTSAPSFLADVAGTYVVQLIVSDPYTSSSPATVTITASGLQITLSPDPLNLTGAPGTLTVTLAEPAPAGGQTVNLGVLDPTVATLPASVLIPAGAFSASVTVTPGAIGSTQVTGSAPGFRLGQAIINVGAQSISVTLATSVIGITKTTTGTVTLSSPAPAGGALVTLSTTPNGIATLQPTSFTIPAGGTTGTFTVTGVGEGSTTISATSPGYSSGGASIQVGKLGLIQVESNVSVGPGQTKPLQISLATPAPVGGATITLASSDTAKLTVTPSVFIAQGQTTPAVPAQVTGVDFGTAVVSASAPGFDGDSQTVTVAASLTFAPPSLTVGIGATQNLTLQLSAPAPAPFNVALVSSNPGAASVPASVLIAQNATSVLVPVTGAAAGTATITATPGALNVVGTTANVTVVLFGTVVLPGGASIGLGQSTPLQVSLSSNAPAGGVTVTLSTSDSAVASLSAPSVFIAAGTNAPATQPVINGVAPGSAIINASAPGFTSASETVQVLGSFTLAPTTLNLAIGSTSNLTVTLSSPAPAGGQLVNLTSTNPAFATVPSTVTIAANATSAQVPVTGVAQGTTTIRAAAFNVTQATSTVNVSNAGVIGLPSNITLGPGQSAPFPVTLSSAAPADLTVNLASSDPTKVTISPASVNILAGQTQPANQPQVTGVNFGSSTISASAPGYSNGSQTVQVAGALNFAPPAVTIPGGSTQNVALNLSVSAPAGGLTVNLSSNSASATVPGSVTIAQGASTVQVPVTGVSGGSATVSASAVNVSGATLNVTVQGGGGGTIGLPGSLTVGAGQSVALPITLPSPAPAGGVVVTLASTDTSKVTVSPTTVNILAGQTTPAQPPQVTGAGLGSANVSASAPGYGGASVAVQVTGTMSLTPPSLTISGNNTQNLTLTLSAAAPAGGVTVNLASADTGVAIVPITVTVAANSTTAPVPVTGVAPGSTTITASAPNLGNATANITVNPGVDIILPAGLVIAPGDNALFPVSLANPAAQFTFLSLSINDPSKATLSTQNLIFQAGSTQPSSQPRINGISPGSVTVTANAQGLANATTTVVIGSGLSFSPSTLTISGANTQNITLSLSSPAPAGGIQVTLNSSNPGVATVNSTAFIPAGVTSINVPVTGVAPGSTVITASAPNVASGTANVTVVIPGTVGVPASTSVQLGNTLAFPITLTTAAPAGGVTVNLTSTNPAIATVSPASVFIAAGQTQPASQPAVTGVNVGNVTINATAPGYAAGAGAVQVGATVTFTTQNVTLTVNTSKILLLALSASAPLAGLTVNLTSSNPAVATVQASVNFFPDGSQFTTVAIPVQGVAAGTTTIHASGINIPDATTTVTVFGPVAFTTTSLPNGTVNTPYSATLAAAGGTQPYTFALISGTLPPNLSLNTATGQITGTPIAPPVANTPLTFRVTDSSASPQTATVNLTLTIVQLGTPVAFTTTSLPNGTANTPYSATLAATGGTQPYTFALISGTLPSNLNLNAATGQISGTPNAPVANTPLTFQVTDSSPSPQTATVNLTLTIAPQGTPVAFTTTSLPNGTAGVPYSATLAATGGTQPYTFALISGTLPSILSLNAATGQISGTPNAPVANTPLTFRVTDSSASPQTATVNLTLTITPPVPASITATSGTPQSAAVNTQFAAPLVATVKDAGNNPVSGVTVTFAAPGSGASGTFAGGVNTAVTNGSGVATSAAFTANGTAGSYNVTASVVGVATPANFALTNNPPVVGPPDSITAIAGTPQSTAKNTTFPVLFAAQVKDSAGNPVSGVNVTFLAPFSEPTGSFSAFNTVQTNASGIATAPPFTASGTTGNYVVNAKVTGVLFPAVFSLTNTDGGSGGGGPQITITGGAVGQALQRSLTVSIPAPAGPGGQHVIINSGDSSKLLLAGRPGDAGTGQIEVVIFEGLTSATGIFAQGLGNSGTVQITAGASGFTTGIASIDLTPSGFVLSGPNGMGQSVNTTQGSAVPLTVSAARLTASNVFAEIQDLRGGTFADVSLNNSTPSAGSVAPPTVHLVGGESTKDATFTASTTNTGATTLSAQAFGFTTPANGANTVVVNVAPSGLTAQPVTVGQNLQTFTNVVLQSPAPAGGLAITLTSSDPSKVLFSATPVVVPDAPPAGSIILNVPGGRTNSQDFYVQGLATGAVNYTASATGFGVSTGVVTVTPAGFVMTGPFGLGQNFPTTSGAANTDLTINSARLTSGLQLAEFQPVRAGLTVNVNVTSSNPSAGTITTSPVTFTGPGDVAFTQFDPAASGNTLLSVVAPSGFSTPASGASLTASVTTPQIAISNLTIGRTLQQPGTLLVGQAAPAGGLQVTLTSNSAQVKLATSPTAVGANSIVITIPEGVTSALYYVQAFSATGTGTYTATASGFAPKTATVTFAPSGIVIRGPFGFGSQVITNTTTDVELTVFTARLNPDNSFAEENIQQLAGGTSLGVLLISPTPGVGTAASPVTITGGSDRGTTMFHPVGPGGTVISVNPPSGYSVPNQFTSVSVQVN